MLGYKQTKSRWNDFNMTTELPSYGSICKLLSKSCNSLQLLFLPVKTSRWVSMFGLKTFQVPEYLGGLT